ncbi:MAG: DUF3108 domain-containing protein [Verrucomicrobium sp.]|nr:DUF3108 domain-containing protein [Verrucomicrobium sp.]
MWAILVLAAHAGIPWQDGEKLSYRIGWGLLPVAHAEFAARKDGALWALHLDLRSRGPIEAVHPIRDNVDSRAEEASPSAPWRSVRYEEDRSEGRHLRHRVTDVDYAAHQAVYRDLLKKSAESFSFKGEGLDDAQSLFYHLRQIDWSQGPERRFIPVYYGKKVLQIEVVRKGKEKIDNPMNDDAPPVSCHVLHMRPIDPDPKKNKEEWATVWLGDDARRIPWRGEFQATFGTFTVTRE